MGINLKLRSEISEQLICDIISFLRTVNVIRFIEMHMTFLRQMILKLYFT